MNGGLSVLFDVVYGKFLLLIVILYQDDTSANIKSSQR
jgi:hypothetical protein